MNVKRILLVNLGATLATAVTVSAVGTNATYGTAGLFRTWSADTIKVPSLDVTMFAAQYWSYDTPEGGDKYMLPSAGLTLCPLKWFEVGGHFRGAFHYREPVVETGTYLFGLGDAGLAGKFHGVGQDQFWLSLGGLVYIDLPTATGEDYTTGKEEDTAWLTDSQNNVGIMALTSKDFLGKMIGINANVGYVIRSGKANYETTKGIYVKMERPNWFAYGVGFDIRPIPVLSVINEYTGFVSQTYEGGGKDKNFEITLGARTNGFDFYHFGLGGAYRISSAAGPDYRGYVQSSMDIPLTPSDRDKDGIPDSRDKCPDDPEDYDGYMDSDGCPDTDNDNDGIPDAVDKCPNEPEDKDGFQDEDGCPDVDNDADGILDVDDKCPNEPEDFNGYEDEDGCPEGGKPVEIPEEREFILEGLRFNPDSPVMVPGSYASLDKAAKVMENYPDINVVIEGHAASTGRPDFETTLSQQRAETVRNELIRTYGIEPSRIRAVGYGSTRPIADNATRDGRARNRRIEFKVE
ncbi:MAG: OmpA family protein [candidate division Zixibacteria bacterium]|nr:OmpA family protein [candidate division Zixibacteria bacterium]